MTFRKYFIILSTVLYILIFFKKIIRITIANEVYKRKNFISSCTLGKVPGHNSLSLSGDAPT
ncbi:hypothetical protein PCK1_000487 [Pneumocystis canis]|nr:hypothetical protein PCK1_000487 [Pneumocystis canis]